MWRYERIWYSRGGLGVIQVPPPRSGNPFGEPPTVVKTGFGVSHETLSKKNI